MAEATRFKDLQEAQKKLDQTLHAESMKRAATETKLQEQIDGMGSQMQEKLEHLTHTLAEIQLQLLNINKGESDSILGNGNFVSSSGFQGTFGSKHVFNTPAPKVEFPRFDGSNPRAWVLKCNSYFKIIPNLLDHQKINLASMHFEGRALQWFQNLKTNQLDITWEQFVDVISVRFEGIREAKVIVEFNKLRQTGSYLDYVDRFEELKSCMLLSNQNKFSEEYFVASFISGLSEELQSFVSMFKPTTLEQAIELGGQQIATLDIISKRMKTVSRPFQSSTTSYKEFDSNTNVKSSPSITLKPPTELLTKAEMAARRQKGLCYNCDEPFTVGHRCKNRISYVMMTEEEELSYMQGELEAAESEESKDAHMEEIHVSLNSILGGTCGTTMRVEGETRGHKLQILIDTGSTLSFLQESTARKVGYQLEKDKPILVRVANGQKLTSTHKVTDFSWNVQGHDFTYTPRILGSEGYDLILGGDWLRHCTPVAFDYKKMTFTVRLNGRKVKLRAITSTADCHFLTEISLHTMVHKNLEALEEVSILKKCIGEKEVPLIESHEMNSEMHYEVEPLVPVCRSVMQKDVPVDQVLVQRMSTGPKFAAMEGLEHCRWNCPSSDPCGQGSSLAGVLSWTWMEEELLMENMIW